MIESINLSFQCNVETISHFLGACDCPLPNRKFSLQRVVLRLFEVFSLHLGFAGLHCFGSYSQLQKCGDPTKNRPFFLQWRIQERGPGAPLFLDQNELLMNTTLVIDGKWLSVECCLETENAPWRPTPVFSVMADTIGYELGRWNLLTC